MKTCFSQYRKAFTLVELLAVIVIVAILGTLIFGVFTSVVRHKNTIACISNVRQITNAILLYCADHNGRLPAVWEEPYKEKSHWTTLLGIYLSEGKPDKRVGRDYLECPTQHIQNKRVGQEGEMSYGVFYTGSGPSFTSTPLFALGQTSGRLVNFRPNTILVGEANGIIYSPSVWKLNSTDGYSSKSQGLYNNAKFPHDSSMVCGFVDGSVRLITLKEWKDGAGEFKLQ